MMNLEQIKDLISRYTKGRTTDDETVLLESWYNSWNTGKDLGLSDTVLKEDLELIFLHAGQPYIKKVPKVILWPKIAAAACILFVFSTVLYFYLAQEKTINYSSDVNPGKDLAILTLANGERLLLDTLKEGATITEGGMRITKTDSGVVSYVAIPRAEGTGFNTIYAPRGGKFQVVLADGTKVYLNAESQLKYPLSFKGSEKRKVVLSGEGYFEVAKDKHHPFIVSSGRQELEVLGTHFNIEAYPKTILRTTLLEGSILLSLKGEMKQQKVVPGQQAVLGTQTWSLVTPNLDQIVAWKNDDFYISGDDFRNIMEKIARWYDVDIHYSIDAPKDIELGGWVSRSKKLSEILKMMEKTGQVHFKLEGREVTVNK